MKTAKSIGITVVVVIALLALLGLLVLLAPTATPQGPDTFVSGTDD